MLLPEDAGGAGTDTVSYALAAEEIAKVSGTDATVLVLANSLVTYYLSNVGHEAHRKELLVPALEAKRIVAVAVAEEAGGAAYDRMATQLVPAEGGFTLRGSKNYVALAPLADTLLVLARGPDGPTMVAVDADAEGVHPAANESKLGLRGLPLTDVYLNRVAVAEDRVVGTPGKALTELEPCLELARLGTAAALVGLTEACLSSAIAFAKDRQQFGQPIARFGAVRAMLADVQADLEAARATTYAAAALRDARKPFAEEFHESRLLAHKIAVRGSRIAHKVHGGAGFMRDLPLERFSRDIRTLMHLWDAQDVSRSRLASLLLD
jgi:alkylation response protein AidB-like acyl-CoA dehydrogenase